MGGVQALTAGHRLLTRLDLRGAEAMAGASFASGFESAYDGGGGGDADDPCRGLCIQSAVCMTTMGSQIPSDRITIHCR